MPVPPSLLAKSVPAPTQIRLSTMLDALELTIAGDPLRLSAERLRAACKCAHCLRARIDGVFPARFEGIAITELAPVGDYALNIGFSDGHARGIYPWSFLLDLKEI